MIASPGKPSARAWPLTCAIALCAFACSSDPASAPSASGGSTGGPAEAHGGNASAAGGSAATSGGEGAAPSEVGGAPSEVGGATSEVGGAPSEVGGAPSECDGSARFATSVVDYAFGPGQSFGQDKFPEAVLGPPRGGGCCGGSLDVTSLGDGGWVVLEFANDAIVDGEGPDFIVFENAFVPSSAPPESVYAELGRVSVSQDGQSWVSFPCTSTAYPFGGCAGWHPTFANADKNTIDPTDPAVSGGDPFDLADLGLGWARYVRIEDLPEIDGGTGTFDLDAVSVVHAGCP